MGMCMMGSIPLCSQVLGIYVIVSVKRSGFRGCLGYGFGVKVLEVCMKW